jgi:hypothetical protein
MANLPSLGRGSFEFADVKISKEYFPLDTELIATAKIAERDVIFETFLQRNKVLVG